MWCCLCGASVLCSPCYCGCSVHDMVYRPDGEMLFVTVGSRVNVSPLAGNGPLGMAAWYGLTDRVYICM